MIQTAANLRAYVLQLIEDNKTSERTLEEYLLAMLRCIQSTKEPQPSYQDIGDFLHTSYMGELAEYSEEWKDLPWLTTTPNSEAYHQEIRSYECQVRQLKIRITGLRQLRLDGVLNKDPSKLWLNGADDYRGSRWYNLTIPSFLERGTALLENIESEEDEYEQCDGWIDFSFIISDGVSHE